MTQGRTIVPTTHPVGMGEVQDPQEAILQTGTPQEVILVEVVLPMAEEVVGSQEEIPPTDPLAPQDLQDRLGPRGPQAERASSHKDGYGTTN